MIADELGLAAPSGSWRLSEKQEELRLVFRSDGSSSGGRTSPLSEWRTRLFGGLADRLAAEGERRLLWLPVFFGAGIGVYFLLKVEPPL